MKKQWRWLVFIVFIACFGISNTMVIADNVGSTENTSLSGSPENKTDNKTSDQNSVSSASSQSDGKNNDEVNNSSTVSSSNSSSASSASSKRSIPKNNILAVSSVNWPKRFATWTQGKRVYEILSRNKYGFMNGVDESADGLHKYVSFNIMAHLSWTSSPKTQFYALYETNGQYHGQIIDRSKVNIVKMESYSYTALWYVSIDLAGISADKVQICIFDDDGSYGFWKSNGVADDKTYPFIISSPIFGWSKIDQSLSDADDKIIYAGQSMDYTNNAPRVSQDNIVKFSNQTLNSKKSIKFNQQTVVNNELKSDYTISTNLSSLENQITGLDQSGNYGISTDLTGVLPSTTQAIKSVQYGGLKSINITPEALAKKTINLKDYTDPKFIAKLQKDLGSNLTYKWFYYDQLGTSMTQANAPGATGVLGQDWLSIDNKSDLGKKIEQQLNSNKDGYLQLKIYSSGKLVTVGNPILIKGESSNFEVPDLIDFGTISTDDVINGSSLESQTSATDVLKVTIPATTEVGWEVTARVPEDGALAKLNGKLNLLGKDITTSPTVLADINKSGESSYDLDAKLIFSGYHGQVDPTKYSEAINWKLEPKITLNASE
ncbi:hypothetical protein E6A54_09610 (plasmid) [Lactobacillus johnsonii]|uniref:hypothetical protein n=1 Tax=Lactobacillus johnsonii TaxID=33959 RepID=UPI001303C2B2|nr:hypothetical protein [Lactobacillus johnsonii]QGY97483.1 hypothetical protein E6A54_09610 [Lactobacillus johnsonii]